jgi:hypothetical protein
MLASLFFVITVAPICLMIQQRTNEADTDLPFHVRCKNSLPTLLPHLACFHAKRGVRDRTSVLQALADRLTVLQFRPC